MKKVDAIKQVLETLMDPRNEKLPDAVFQAKVDTLFDSLNLNKQSIEKLSDLVVAVDAAFVSALNANQSEDQFASNLITELEKILLDFQLKLEELPVEIVLGLILGVLKVINLKQSLHEQMMEALQNQVGSTVER